LVTNLRARGVGLNGEEASAGDAGTRKTLFLPLSLQDPLLIARAAKKMPLSLQDPPLTLNRCCCYCLSVQGPVADHYFLSRLSCCCLFAWARFVRLTF
jgi:hypothetical protein